MPQATVMMKYLLLGAACVVLVACSEEGYLQPKKGDLAKSGGSPTIRRSFKSMPDDPYTSNDESNDQPVGYFGTLTMSVSSLESGNSYTLDADVDGTTVDRVYFPKGGWVDFFDCELDDGLIGTCLDERGRSWSFDGEGWSGSEWAVEDEAEVDPGSTGEGEEDNFNSVGDDSDGR
jgi:hypothetical protein